MKLAVNYSPQAEHLVSQQAVKLDLFKCPPASDPVMVAHTPDFLTQAAWCRPVYIHFPLYAGGGALEAIDWTEIETALYQTGTPYVNVHLQAETKDFPSLRADTNAPADVSRLTEVFIRDVAVLTKRFGPERVIVENVVYRGGEGKYLYPCVDPDVLCQVVAETNCGLLLDTAHARLTCLALGRDVKEYIARLPVAQLKELHVTGAQFDGQRVRDSMAMGNEDWAIVEWAMQEIKADHWGKPWVLAFEYGGIGPGFEWRSEAEVIAEQLPRLWDLAQSV